VSSEAINSDILHSAGVKGFYAESEDRTDSAGGGRAGGDAVVTEVAAS